MYPAEISTTAETQETWNDCSRKTKIKIRLIDYIIYMKLVLVFILKVVLWFLTYLSNLRRWFFFSAFSKRRELQDHGRLSLTLQSAHVDPLGRSLLISPCRKCFPGGFSFHWFHIFIQLQSMRYYKYAITIYYAVWTRLTRVGCFEIFNLFFQISDGDFFSQHLANDGNFKTMVGSPWPYNLHMLTH